MLPDVRELLAEAVVGPALDLVVQVHDRDSAAAEDVLDGLNDEQLKALAMVLAAMVPDDEPFNDLIGWVGTSRSVWPPVTPEQAAENRRILLGIGEPQRCVGCGLMKPPEAFNVDSGNPTGRRPRCKSCLSEQRRERREARAVLGVAS